MGIFQNGKLYNTLNVKYLLMRIYKRFFCVSILPLKINLQCSLLSSSQTMVIITQQLFNMALFGCAGSSCNAGFPLVMLGRSCGARASLLLYGLQPSRLLGSPARAQELWRPGWAASRHAGSSRTWGHTCVSCLGRQILHHWATRETSMQQLLMEFLFVKKSRLYMGVQQNHLY